MSEVKLGKPRYEQKTKNYFSFKKDQNTFILRILPPMGKLADEGRWSIYHRVEYGYCGSDGRMKPFLSPRVVNRDKMVEVESYAHLRREQIKEQEKQAKESGNLQLQEQCKKLLEKYNQDAKHYMNAIDLDGNIGLFKIGHKGFSALKLEIDKLRNKGVDPVGIDNGRFFIFSRSGKGRETIYTVQEYKEKQMMNGMEVEVAKPHAINGEILAKLATDAFELGDIYPTVTPEQEYKIVNGGAAGVDEVFGKSAVNPASTAAETTTTTTTTKTAGITPEMLSKAMEEASAPTVKETAQVTEQLAVTPTMEAPAVEQTVTTPTPDFSGMSEEDFFKLINNG